MDRASLSDRVVQYERMWATGNRCKSVLAMSHPTAMIVFGVSVAAFAIILERGLPPLDTLLKAALGMVFAQATIGIVNEICDFDLDRAAKPWRALPAGLISPRGAIGFALLCFSVAVLLGLSISPASALLLCGGVGLGALYSLKLKRTAFSWLPYALAYPSVLLWAAVSLERLRVGLLWIYMLAFPFVLAVHLCNQLRDFDQDEAMRVVGLVQRLGKERASRLCIGLLMAAPLPLALNMPASVTAASFALLVPALVHWALMVSGLSRTRFVPPDLRFRLLMRRIQLSGPLMLAGWLLNV